MALLGDGENRFYDLLIPCAAAEISGNGLPHFKFCRGAVLIEEGLGRERHAGCAEAALDGPVVDKGLLNGVECAVGVLHPFNRCDLSAIGLEGKGDTGLDGLAVEEDRAGPAFPESTALLGAGKVQVLAEKLQKRLPGLDGHLVGYSVHGDVKIYFLHGIKRSLSMHLLQKVAMSKLLSKASEGDSIRNGWVSEDFTLSEPLDSPAQRPGLARGSP